MLPFFIFLLIIIVSFLLIYLSTIEIEVKNLSIDTKRKISKFLIYIRLRLFNKLTWAKIKIDDSKKEKYKKINEKIKNNINWKEEIKGLKDLQEVKPILKKINLKVKIDALNPILTSSITTIISIMFSLIIANTIEKYNRETCKYEIIPEYKNEAKLEIFLNCIICIKMVHIINTIIKKGSAENGEHSSYRRAYENINGKY